MSPYFKIMSKSLTFYAVEIAPQFLLCYNLLKEVKPWIIAID